MSHACHLLPCGFFVALALATNAHASAVGPDVTTPEMCFQHEVTYASGGVGSNERDTMRVVARRLNVRLNVVSASTGEALPDVDVSVVGDHGKFHLRMRTEGSLLYMRLPRGYCQITVVYRGAIQAVNASVGTQPAGAAVRLCIEPGPDEWLLC